MSVPENTEIQDKDLVKIPYQTTLIQMFEGIHSGIKSSAYTQTEIVDLFSNATAIINEDCNNCKKLYGKQCNCKKLKKVSRLTESSSKNLEVKMGNGKQSKQFKKYATSRTKKTLKALLSLPDKLVSFVEKTSSIFLNVTKCYKTQDSVFLITGGDDPNRVGAEIYNPMTNSGCVLPQLPVMRYAHTQNENVLCGGGWQDTTLKSCITWNSKSGTWTQSHTLNEKRLSHISWASESGLFLFGGEVEAWTELLDTTELLTESGVFSTDMRDILFFRIRKKHERQCYLTVCPSLSGLGLRDCKRA